MPCGSSRSSTIATASRATSPNTGVVRKLPMVHTLPSSTEAVRVPVSIAAPPVMTVMNALAM